QPTEFVRENNSRLLAHRRSSVLWLVHSALLSWWEDDGPDCQGIDWLTRQSSRTLRFRRRQWPKRGTSGATVLIVKGALYIFLALHLLGLPARPMLQHGVENRQELMHTLTFRTNFREKMRSALSSWDEQKDHSNPRTSRRHTGHHRAPQEDARGRIIGQTLPDQWQLAGIESRLDDSRVVGLHPLRGRPPALSGRAVGQRTSAHPQAVHRQKGHTARPD